MTKIYSEGSPEYLGDTRFASSGEVGMKITAKPGEKAHTNEEKILVGKTPNGRDVFVIVNIQDMKGCSIDQLKSSAMEYLKKHPSLIETKGAKLNVPLVPMVAKKEKLSSTDKWVSVVASDIKPVSLEKAVLESSSTEQLLPETPEMVSPLSSDTSLTGSESEVQEESVVEDPFKDFNFDRSPEILGECQDKAEKLHQKIDGLLADPDRIFVKKVVVFGEELIETLREFESIDPSNFNVHIELTELLGEKIDEIDRMIDQGIETGAIDINDLYGKELFLRKLISEIRIVGAVPSGSSILKFVVEDEAIRKKWSECLAEKGQSAPYSVPFEEFYKKVILNVFPEMKEDQEFHRFMSDLMNSSGDKNITAWTWSQFVELSGSIEEFRALILENKGNRAFIQEYMTALSEIV